MEARESTIARLIGREVLYTVLLALNAGEC
jgi:hypothetical protein